VTVDADHFERLLISGRQALGAGRYHQASALLRNALDLWRGQPLADVAGMPFAAGEIRRLQQLRRAAELARIESDAHRGLHHEIISDLAAMVTQWPDDEALRYLFIVCLYRCGRTALAAQACREGIEVLLDHGLDTSRLHGLQRLILGPPSRDPLPLAAWPQP
jgi:DNA-binding SARP family transcriptional activator